MGSKTNVMTARPPDFDPYNLKGDWNYGKQ